MRHFPLESDDRIEGLYTSSSFQPRIAAPEGNFQNRRLVEPLYDGRELCDIEKSRIIKGVKKKSSSRL